MVIRDCFHRVRRRVLSSKEMLWLLQMWHLQPDTQAEVDLALKEMQSMTKPIIAFHVRGDGRDTNLLFDVRPCTSALNIVAAGASCWS